jgi:hypothetical protein
MASASRSTSGAAHRTLVSDAAQGRAARAGRQRDVRDPRLALRRRQLRACRRRGRHRRHARRRLHDAHREALGAAPTTTAPDASPAPPASWWGAYTSSPAASGEAELVTGRGGPVGDPAAHRLRRPRHVRCPARRCAASRSRRPSPRSRPTTTTTSTGRVHHHLDLPGDAAGARADLRRARRRGAARHAGRPRCSSIRSFRSIDGDAGVSGDRPCSRPPRPARPTSSSRASARPTCSPATSAGTASRTAPHTSCSRTTETTCRGARRSPTRPDTRRFALR